MSDYEKTEFKKPSKETLIAESTGGVKFDSGKIPLELLSPIALVKISEALAFGARKYDENNWRKGMKWTRVAGAAFRHLLAWLGGEDKDPESGLSHLSHLGCCVMFLLEYETTKPELDDRWKP